MNTENKQSSEAEAPLPYEKPEFKRHRLDIITLGGTPGSGDSGAPGAEENAGSGVGHEEEGWDDNGGKDW
ncbi:hypothetical protein [Wenzhouxiangella marina]|nr:hypothetical protein [Wenzhouxiangella marina]MBB6087581.1 hypothetical protein [Wenzhouxiangella marina]